MKHEPITISLNVTRLHKEISREAFQSMPKVQKISDKRKRPPKYGYKFDFRESE